MVFSSFPFLLLFLPVVYAAFVLAHRLGGWPAAFKLLVVASLVFYAQWSLHLLAILLVSATANFAVGEIMMRLTADRTTKRALLVAGVAGNVGALVYFKYMNFLIDIANQVSGVGVGVDVELLDPQPRGDPNGTSSVSNSNERRVDRRGMKRSPVGR